MSKQYLFYLTLALFQFVFHLADCGAQNVHIHGYILDDLSNDMLSDCFVEDVQNTQNATVSNQNGWFELLNTSGVIRISHVGYEGKEVSVKNLTTDTLIIMMHSSESRLDQIVVTGNKSGSKIKELTISMESVSPNLVQDKNPIQIDEIIEQVPGLTITDNQVSIRSGSGWSYGAGSRTIVMVDDIPLLSGDAGQALWSFISTENLEQIEIVKGASSVLYGSSALNGIINVRTRWASDSSKTKITSFGGQYNRPKKESWKWQAKPLYTYGVRVADSRRIGKSDFVSNLEALNDQGYRSGDFDERLQAGLNWRYRLSDSSFIGIRGRVFKNHSGSFLLWKNYDSAFLPLDGSNTTNNNIRYNIDPFYTKIDRKGNEHRLRSRILKVKNRVDNGNPDNDQSNQSLTLYGEYLFRTQLNLQKEKGLVGNLSAGFMGSRTTTSSPLFSGDQKTSNLALYAQFEQKIGRFKFELGSRYEHYTLNAYTENKPIFRSGLNYQLRKATFLRGSYGQGYRFPTIAESYISTSVGPVSVFPNKNLKSETGDNLEFGVIQGLSFGKYFKGLLNISLFQMRYKEMMEFSFGQWSSDISPENGFGIGFKSINTGSTTISGYEFSVNLDYDKRPWKMSWMGGYTFSNPLIDNPNEIWGKDSVGNNLTFISTSSDTAGYYLKYRSRHVWKVDWQTNYGPWTAGVSLRYNNAPDNVDAAFVKPPISFLVPGIQKSRDINDKGDLIVDFRFFYQFKNYRTGVIINNLFNEDRFVRPSDIGPPRLVTIQIQYVL